MKAPGSPSSALQMRLRGAVCRPRGRRATSARWESPRRRGRAGPTRLDRLDDVAPGHAEAVLEGPVAAAGQVVVDLLGIDDAAVAQHDAHLVLEHGVVGETGRSANAVVGDGHRGRCRRASGRRRDVAIAVGRVEAPDQMPLGHLAGQQGVERLRRPARRSCSSSSGAACRGAARRGAAPGSRARCSRPRRSRRRCRARRGAPARRRSTVAGPGRQAARPHADVDDRARARLRARPARLGAPAAALKRRRRSSSIPCSLQHAHLPVDRHRPCVTTGARAQHPRQATRSRSYSPSGVVSPALTCSRRSRVSSICTPPLT